MGVNKMVFSITIDWRKELRECDRWENVGRYVIESNCDHKTQDSQETNMRYSGYCEECDFHEDSAQPMMNYAYPLVSKPEDEEVLEVVRKTNCTVMHNTETDEYFLVLSGGGMDLSQDVALAYLIIQNMLPYSLAVNICTAKDFTVVGEDWKRLRKGMIDNLKRYRNTADYYLNEWEIKTVEVDEK